MISLSYNKEAEINRTFDMFYKRGYPLEARITPKTENCRVYKFSGPD